MGDTGFTLGQTAHTPLKNQKVPPNDRLLILVTSHHSIKIEQKKVYPFYLNDIDVIKFIIIITACTI